MERPAPQMAGATGARSNGQRCGRPALDRGGIRVLVVEDNFYTRYGMVAFLGQQARVEVVGAAADGGSALPMFEELRPDIVLVGVRMPLMAGIELTRSLCRQRPDARILVLTSHQTDGTIFAAIDAGASGYLSKDSSGEELLSAIFALDAGERFLPPAVAERIARGRTRLDLTRRERQVLEQVADGASNRELAETLGISERTAGFYVSSILGKFGARSRTEAVSMALHQGLLPPVVR